MKPTLELVNFIKSPLTNELYEQIKRLSLFPTTVLIEGEIGSEKGKIAETIHSLSKRANMPFVKVNCGLISDHLSGTELFGTDHTFANASSKSQGLIETADQGTLFFEEVGELSPTLQARLLRFLQDRENDRVGGSWSKKINIRIIASTTTPLRQLVNENKFREDLFYWLNAAHLKVPPLRQRQEEIVPLIDYFLDYFCKEYKMKKSFKNETLEILKNYSFPGNSLELKNLVERLCVTSSSEYILPADLPETIYSQTAAGGSLESQVAEFESHLIRQALEMEGSIRKAAGRLQISHATLLRKMQKWHIEKG